MGKKGGGGRVGFGTSSNKGPKNLGGRSGAGGRVTGGGAAAALARLTADGTKDVSLANFARESGLGPADALTAVDLLVAANRAEFTHLGPTAAAILRANGRAVPERDGRPVRGFRLTGVV